MFNYHDENHCPFDLWAPDRHTKINNVAFSAYAVHEQEKADIVEAILARAAEGDYNFNIDVNDDFSDEDLEEIKTEVLRRLR